MQKVYRRMPRFHYLGLVLAFLSIGFGLLLPGAAWAAPLRGADGFGCQSIHPVQVGQTLAAIANYYQVDMAALMAANQLNNPNRIYAGQSLCITNGIMGGMTGSMMDGMGQMHEMDPMRGDRWRMGGRERMPEMGQMPDLDHRSMPRDFTYYTVCAGDTLAQLAWRYGVDVPYLMQLNNLPNPNRIDVGQVLKVPKGFMPGMPQSGPQAPQQPPPAPPSVNDWHGAYYNNKNLQGGPTFERTDADINFAWGAGGPGNGIGNDNFSVRWTRATYFSAGNYRFFVTVDDGVRLYVDNILVIDSWRIQPLTNYFGDIQLGPGNHTVRLDYYEETGDATIRLNWRRF